MRAASLAVCVAVLSGCGGDDAAPDDEPVDPDALIVPDETADPLALARLSDWRALPVLGTGRYAQQSSHDRETGAPVSVSLLQNGNRDLNNFVCKSADAEMGTSLVEPLFDLESCPESYVRGLVMARVEGPGMLSRLQLTQLSLRAAPADDEVLRVYVDDSQRPLIQAPLSAVLDGSAGEIFAPPFGRGSTHHLAWYYPISFGKRLIVALDRVGALDLVYYQADFVLDEAHAAAKNQRRPERDAAKALLESLEDGPLASELVSLLASKPVTVATGQSVSLGTVKGPATIQRLELELAKADLPALGSVFLDVVWDSQATPAIHVPLSFFYATALSEPTRPSLPLVAQSSGDRVTLALRLPMPFASQATFSVSSSASVPVTLALAARGEPSVPDSFARLHVGVSTTVGPTTNSHHPVLSVEGRGRFVGTCAMMEGHALTTPGFSNPLNFLEGDFRGSIDGTLAVRDTGTEDYFNACFYFESGELGFAFGQAWGVKSAAQSGQVSACRWNVLTDVVDFQQSFALDQEIGPGAPELLDRYRSVSYFYR